MVVIWASFFTPLQSHTVNTVEWIRTSIFAISRWSSSSKFIWSYTFMNSTTFCCHDFWKIWYPIFWYPWWELSSESLRKSFLISYALVKREPELLESWLNTTDSKNFHQISSKPERAHIDENCLSNAKNITKSKAVYYWRIKRLKVCEKLEPLFSILFGLLVKISIQHDQYLRVCEVYRSRRPCIYLYYTRKKALVVTDLL